MFVLWVGDQLAPGFSASEFGFNQLRCQMDERRFTSSLQRLVACDIAALRHTYLSAIKNRSLYDPVYAPVFAGQRLLGT